MPAADLPAPARSVVAGLRSCPRQESAVSGIPGTQKYADRRMLGLVMQLLVTNRHNNSEYQATFSPGTCSVVTCFEDHN